MTSTRHVRARHRAGRVASVCLDVAAVLLAGACGSALPSPAPVAESPAHAATIAAAPQRNAVEAPVPTAAVLAKTTNVPKAPCPSEMAEVVTNSRHYCVDRWEASLVRSDAHGALTAWPDNKPVDGVEDEIMAVSRPGVMPQGYINEEQAGRACARAGKRLCTLGEWRTACSGPAHRQYPYGNARHAGTCNDTDGRKPHPVVRLFDQFAAPGTPRSDMWNTVWMNDPRLHDGDAGLMPTGAAANCTNEFGVYDMVGNLHEWVDDPSGSFAGGFFMDTRINGEGCAYLTTAHVATYHDYSTGFRCCADASE